MARTVKKTAWILAAILILLAGYALSSGFQRMENCCIADFSLSQDGNRMTVQIGVVASIGHVRALNARAEDGTLYIDPVSAFGGINGNWGAKSTFDIHVEGVQTISIKRTNGYEAVLTKTGEGWGRP